MKFLNIFKKKWPKDSELVIVPAFKYQGVQYYKLDNLFTIPTDRGFEAQTFLEEMNMRCTRSFLEAHVQAKNKIYSDTSKIDIATLIKLDMQLEERLKFIFEPTTIYKLASIVYFDENENPYRYDFKYNLDKIKKWRESGADFFFLEPIKILMPFLDMSNQDLDNFLRVMKKINKVHLDSLSRELSESDKKSDYYKKLLLEMQEEYPRKNSEK